MRSAALMLGYYKEPELTRAAFTDDGWMRTGDKGEIDASGKLRITGRLKDLFKTSKGKYVAPAPIEDKLVMHDAVEACVGASAAGHQPDAGPARATAYLVVATTAWTVDNDIITPSFKVKRNRIEEVYAAQYEAWEASGRRVIWLPT